MTLARIWAGVMGVAHTFILSGQIAKSDVLQPLFAKGIKADLLKHMSSS